MIKKLLIVWLTTALTFQTFSEESRLLRFPAIWDNKIAFSYGGDLYVTTLEGGIARKITSHKGYEMFPRYSPDGKWIAFTGQYDGNTEVYLIPSEGGTPKRLTYTATLDRDDVGDRMGPNNIVMTWTPDGQSIVYRSRKQSFNDFKGMLFKVSKNGGLSEELPFSVAGFCSYSPDGKKIAYNRVFREFRTWKRYRGGMADDIWIYDFQTKSSTNITENPAQDIIPMWIGNEIYYASDRTGRMNIFAYNTDNRTTRQITFFTDYDVKFPSTDGKNIVFENAGYIYYYDVKKQLLSKISISISDDALWARSEYKDASQNIHSFDISPNGERAVFGARGDVFSLPVEKGITLNLTRSPGVHERNVAWSPDGKYIAYISDVTGNNEIFIRDQSGSTDPIQITKNTDTYIFDIKWSSDGKKILWSDRKFRLQFVDILTRQTTLVAQSNRGHINAFSWSPDNQWIAFSQAAENNMGVIYVYHVPSKKLYPLTDSWFDSDLPIFSTNGKYLAFVSARDFNPIYGETEWNHIYINMSRIYLILLNKDIPSPFGPKNDEVAIADSTGPASKAGKDVKKEVKKDEKVNVVIDFDNLAERILPLPIKPSGYSNLFFVNNSIYYIEHSTPDGTPTLKRFDLNKNEENELGKNLNYCISANGKKMLVKEGSKWAIIDLPESKITPKTYLDLSEMQVWVDYAQEWKQIYDEAWRQMRDFFYVENMHGLDWRAIHDKYAPLVPHVRHRDDLTYIIGEMIGELNVGHAYVNSGQKPKADRIPVGLLGAKLSKDVSGFFRIDSIYKGASYDKNLRSPLTEPGVNVKKGEFILAVDGISTQNYSDIYELLVYKAEKEVQLTVNKTPDFKGSRKVIVIPLRSEADLIYYNWVQNNIRKVSEATNGEVGYIHIPDMVTEGLNEFAKYFYPQLNKKVLIIDDRGNGGGNVSPQIIERLNRQLIRLRGFRNATVAFPVPGMMVGPKIMLIDQYSASDGDLFAYAFKKLKIGPLIGQRTWGGVIGISGSLPFIDGTDLRKPEYFTYSADSSEWIIEGYGVDPDIEVINDPAREYLGIDDQLNKAIEIAKEKLKEYKPLPPIPPAPDKSK
ncbi:MAG: PDZ domain-containing protein [Bacteroidales bacterium]|nr:PDZ domain-containing protein [Bacteroidales bacterium]